MSFLPTAGTLSLHLEALPRGEERCSFDAVAALSGASATDSISGRRSRSRKNACDRIAYASGPFTGSEPFSWAVKAPAIVGAAGASAVEARSNRRSNAEGSGTKRAAEATLSVVEIRGIELSRSTNVDEPLQHSQQLVLR